MSDVGPHFVGRAGLLYKSVETGGMVNLLQKIQNDPSLKYRSPLPTVKQHGMAKSSTCDEFDSKEFIHFPDGIVCEICIRQTFSLSLSKKNGNKLMCDSCRRSSLSRVTRSTPVTIKKQMCPVTSSRLNHIAVVGRSSRGDAIEMDKFQNLMRFIETWQLFPYRKTHLHHFLDYFGGNGNGLANYTSMTRSIYEDSHGNKMVPLSHIVKRFQAVHRPGMDKVSIVFYQIAGLTVKISNLVKLLNDFELAGIPKEDVSLVAYGKKAIDGRKTFFDPYSISGTDIINISEGRQTHEIVDLMKSDAMGRIFALAPGRNNGA